MTYVNAKYDQIDATADPWPVGPKVSPIPAHPSLVSGPKVPAPYGPTWRQVTLFLRRYNFYLLWDFNASIIWIKPFPPLIGKMKGWDENLIRASLS